MSRLWLLPTALWSALAVISGGPAVPAFGALAGLCLIAALLAAGLQARLGTDRRPAIAGFPEATPAASPPG
jgi:hypothetical protein